MTQKRFFLLLPSVAIGVLAVVGLVSAATTISTSVQTAGGVYATSSMEVDGQVVLTNPAINSILAINASGVVIATSTPTFGNFYATSTVATSTISTGGLTVGVSQFIVQQNSGNVGLGTTTPTNKLDINGNLYTSGTSYFGGAITATSTVTVTKSVKAADLYASSTLEVDGAITGLTTITATGAVTASNLYASSTVEIDGAITASSAATTTIKAVSTHATRGFCLQFNATSTNTLLNMTFMASTTAPTQGSGVIPTVNYGACN